MKIKNLLFVIFGLVSSSFFTGCSNKNINIEDENTNANNNLSIEPRISNKEHTFKTEDARYIIESFVTINPSMSFKDTEEYFYAIGNVNKKNVGKNIIELQLINNELEEVTAYFYKDELIFKIFKRDTYSTNTLNSAFIQYQNDELNLEYSSGLYKESGNNIASNLDIWDIEEKVFYTFN